MKLPVDWCLYLVLDPSVMGPGHSLELVARAAAAGGVTVVQLRHKCATARDMLSAASLLRAVTRELGLPLVINDRIDVALAVDADGVHLGLSDMPLALARRLLGPEKIIGASAGNLVEARQALSAGADYLGVGAVYHTHTKADAGKPIGLDGLQEVVQIADVPVIGIGGINAGNLGDVMRAGAAGVAIASAILAVADVSGAARNIRTNLEKVARC